MCRNILLERDSLKIEIPIERHPSLGDKSIHSEILIAHKSEVQRILANMPHIEKILKVLYPSSLFWDPKDIPFQVLGENQESIEAISCNDRIMLSLNVYGGKYIYAIHITD
jgi:hypothetical protein